jgi:hypothetical protein
MLQEEVLCGKVLPINAFVTSGSDALLMDPAW